LGRRFGRPACVVLAAVNLNATLALFSAADLSFDFFMAHAFY